MSTTNGNVVIRIQVKPGQITLPNNVNNGVQLYSNTTRSIISAFGESHKNAVTEIVPGSTITFYAVNYNRNNDQYKNYKVYMLGIERKEGANDLVGLPARVDDSIQGDSPNYLVCDVLEDVGENPSDESYTITIELKDGDNLIGVYDIDPKLRMRSRGGSS